MLPDRVSNPGPLTYESGALPIALRRPAQTLLIMFSCAKKIMLTPGNQSLLSELQMGWGIGDDLGMIFLGSQ